MKTAFNILGVIALALALGACGKKSSSSSAVTPTNVCTTGYYVTNGVYYNQGGIACSLTGVTTNSCLSGNYSYNPTTGQYVDNTTGQIVNCTGTGTGAIPGNNGYGCDYWTNYYRQQGYNVSYVAVNIGNQLACVRSDILYGQQAYGGYGVPNYGQQNFYTCQYGYNCGYYGPYGSGYGTGSTCMNLGGTSFGSTYGLSGNIGICW
jgi:hypothetical protein